MATLTLQPDATAGMDNTLEQAAATSNNGTYAKIDAIMDGSGNIRRGLIQFDISSIPALTTITSAVLSLWTETGLSTNELSLHRVTAAWVEAESTWNKRTTANNWSSAGGDYDGTADATATPANTTAGTQTDFTVTALVQEWINGTSNYGMLLRVTSESSTSRGLQFHSSDGGTANLRPRLVVTYPGQESGYIFMSQ